MNNDVFIHVKVIKLDPINQSQLMLTSFFSADIGDVKRLSHSPVWPQRFVSVYEVQRLREQQQSDQSQLQVRRASQKDTAQICPSPILHFYWKLENMSESQGSHLVLVVTTTLSLWAVQRTSMCTSGAHTTTWANSPLYGETAMTSGKGSKVMMEQKWIVYWEQRQLNR